MTNCKYKLRKLSVGLVSVGTMLIAPTVLGQEVSASSSTESSTTTANTGTGTASGMTATTPSATTDTGEAAGSGTSSGTTVATTNGGSQSTQVAAETTPPPQAQTAVASSSSSSNATASSSSEEKTPKTATSSTPSTPVAASNNSNQVTGTEAEPQMMDVEQYKIKDENSSITVADKDKQLKIRRDIANPKDKDLFDVKREVKDNGDGTLDVTLKVMPKQIDEGADVMALLDVSQKMTDADFKNAKEKIKKLVTTLTSKSPDGQPNLNNRNTVRLMTFYREISEPIDLSGKTEQQVCEELDKIWNRVKTKDWDWGVDLQGAIHKAREIFRKEKESKKRQHIVLFSQGESTFSYDIQKSEKEKSSNLSRIRGEITSSNPLLPWPPIFDHTNKSADMLKDVSVLVSLAKKLGIESLDSLESILKTTAIASGFGGLLTGQGSLTEYLSLQEYKTDNFNKEKFDYGKRVGEGYYHYSFSKRKSYKDAPLKFALEQALNQLFPKSKSEKESWLDNILKTFSLGSYQEVKKKALMTLIDYMFYQREYHYYNHNLSAIAEAKMAQQEGITFYSVDVTDSETTPKRVRRQTAVRQEKAKKESKEERNKKFDEYLKRMSEGQKFLSNVEDKDKFKDTLTKLTVKDEFTEKVTVQKGSKGEAYHKTSLISETPTVSHTAAGTSLWFSNTKESLTWTISKDQLKKAFESGKPLTLTYKLKVEKEKFKKALQKQQEHNRKKRAASPESENTVTETIISTKISYKINDGKDTNNDKLEDVKMSYSKFKMPIPELNIEVVVPKVPEKPRVEPMTPLYPAIPNYPTPQLPKDEDLEISGGHGPIVDIVEDTGTGVEGGAQNGVVSTQENKDPIVDITEDTQPGMSGSNDATVIEEDTIPKRPDVHVGGQSDPIDITEDTQPSVSGSNDATVVEEDTVPKRPDILVGGQSDPIDITEDTQPGMSGSNDATVIEEDTKPKRFFHFDNEPQAPEKPKEQPSLSLPQAPVYKAAHHLPASGDKREASFTIVALTIIGAAGLLSKKRRDTEEN
ncbi:serum opacification factor [Streptococcus pyogenes]|uniref:serum opacification factor n=1 Tax=Streptococcus pyogenes TaxID=1314 RepID=UPI0004BE266F|nr:serum opacification factor [Streptococcus pyogenes]HER4680153.1 fibronectin binding protein [Streptococcus pyogenes NGAS340]HER4737372.1 fibronectin binding protein [Streptococcus pyogenes NGAS311]UEN97385.1 fibronectin binding protein [Streptococcus pyogenes]HEP1524420.1 fibronectin binding protein [Streptococcus pyogenes]HEQ0807197.1 fibronectin binding protein [Streptococcus pyogenes]